MAIYLYNKSWETIEFEKTLPEEYTGPFLKGNRTLYYAKDGCKLIVQEIISELYILRLNLFRFLDSITLRSVSQREGFHSRLIIEGQLRHKIEGAGKILLRENEYTMIYTSRAQCECVFKKDIDYKALDIYYSTEIINEFSVFFPQINLLLQGGKTKKLLKHPAVPTPAMREIIQQILHCPFDESTRRFYFDLKIREYLFLILQHHFHSTPLRYTYTDYEKECILNAEKMLTRDLAKKPLSLRALAKAAYISEFKLKEGFKEIFGQSVFDYLHEARMNKARALLLETNEPIKSICVQTGYTRITSFITAYRKHFGHTPGSLRRN